MGQIPNRQIFTQKFLQVPLTPYFQAVNCVKSGDMDQFRKIVAKYDACFKTDKNFSLIQRLKHTVLKFGLKKLNVSYSKISLIDIQKKLSLESLEETEQIVAKAIRDGVITAFINHDDKYMESRIIHDVYATNDPQNMMDKRIKFCMELHKDAVKALDYPMREDKRDFADLDDQKSENELDLLAAFDDLDDMDEM